jgi:hypothetical protein
VSLKNAKTLLQNIDEANSIGGKMVSVLDSGVVEHGFEHSPVKDYNISIFSFSAKHTTLMSKGKELLFRHQDNVSDKSYMSIHRLLCQ